MSQSAWNAKLNTKRIRKLFETQRAKRFSPILDPDLERFPLRNHHLGTQNTKNFAPSARIKLFKKIYKNILSKYVVSPAKSEQTGGRVCKLFLRIRAPLRGIIEILISTTNYGNHRTQDAGSVCKMQEMRTELWHPNFKCLLYENKSLRYVQNKKCIIVHGK